VSARRFIINSRSIRDGYASFNGDLFNHIVRVLRLGTGTPLALVDEQGINYNAVIDQVDREWVVVKISGSQPAPDSPPAPRITICQALPKGDKTELILQKCTELGAHDFWLFGGQRSVARLREDQRQAKLERWNRITAEAARQCGRHSIPAVSWFPTAVEVASACSHELRLLLWEGERRQSLKSLLADHGSPAAAIVVVGPEGGFDPQEVELFSSRGFLPVTLGKRILRTETAALAIAAILQYIWDDF